MPSRHKAAAGKRRAPQSLKNKLGQYKALPYLLVALMIILANLVFSSSDLVVFFLFIILVPIFAYFEFDGRINVAYAILMLLLAAIILPSSSTGAVANQLAISAYWLIVVGVLCITINYLREKKGK